MLAIKRVLNYKKRFDEFNLKMNTRRYIKKLISRNNTPKLTSHEVKAAKAYFKSKGYKLQNTYWHRHYKALNGEFHVDYIPEDIFRPIICPRFNQMIQWPALLDKNLTYNLFKDFNQPKRVVQNVNGFYYVNGEIVNEAEAIEVCNKANKPLVIKPTIESGQGKMVHTFTVTDGITSNDQQSVSALFELYKKDFIVQEFVEQSDAMKNLNPSTLNTLRIMTYLRPDGVHVLSTVARIGKPDSPTDNYTIGGIICGVTEQGLLKKTGYTRNGEVMQKTYTNVVLEDYKIPNYQDVVAMVKAMHKVVPYFKFISWDIGMDKNDAPLLVEYNTYYQSTELHQVTNGPLFGAFTDEILALGLKPY